MQKLMIMPLQVYNGTKRELLITTSLLVKVPFYAKTGCGFTRKREQNRYYGI